MSSFNIEVTTIDLPFFDLIDEKFQKQMDQLGIDLQNSDDETGFVKVFEETIISIFEDLDVDISFAEMTTSPEFGSKASQRIHFELEVDISGLFLAHKTIVIEQNAVGAWLALSGVVDDMGELMTARTLLNYLEGENFEAAICIYLMYIQDTKNKYPLESYQIDLITDLEMYVFERDLDNKEQFKFDE